MNIGPAAGIGLVLLLVLVGIGFGISASITSQLETNFQTTTLTNTSNEEITLSNSTGVAFVNTGTNQLYGGSLQSIRTLNTTPSGNGILTTLPVTNFTVNATDGKIYLKGGQPQGQLWNGVGMYFNYSYQKNNNPAPYLSARNATEASGTAASMLPIMGLVAIASLVIMVLLWGMGQWGKAV